MSGSTIGGIVGGVIGYVVSGYNPSGAYYGYAIGAGVGALAFQETQPGIQGPRLQDLRAQSSEYGRPIPIVKGTVGVSGNVIWAADLVEASSTTESGGKGGGGGTSTTSYSYSANFAIALCEGPINSVTRIWAGPEKSLIYDAGTGSIEGGTLRVYLGNETQLPDPLIEANLGVGNVPAYRGTAYFVFEMLPLGKHFNTIPFLTVEVVASSGAAILMDIVSDLASRAGLVSEQYDVTALTDTVSGYVIAKQTTVRSAIEPLQKAYYFDAVESDGKVKCVKRGGALMATIPDDDLGAGSDGQGEVDLVKTVRRMENELPKSLNINYMLAALDYAPGTRLAKRLVGSSGEQTSLEMPLVLTEQKAQEIADVNLYTAWSSRIGYTFSLSRKYGALEPTDLVSLKGRAVRITSIRETASGVLMVDGVSEDIG